MGNNFDITKHKSLTIASNDPDEPSIVVDFIGNGGGDFIYPEAILSCPSNITLPGSVNINGRDHWILLLTAKSIKTI